MPWRWKRTILICKVQNTALSAVECFLPSEAQHRRLDSIVAYYARVAMRGKACTKVNGVVTKSLSSEGVLRYWMLAPASVEAKVRRLRWWQTIAMDPDNNVQVLCALFAAARIEGDRRPSDEDGRLTEHANEWARRVQEDVYDLCCAWDGGMSLWEELDGSILRVSREATCREWFCRMDPGILRKQFTACSVPPVYAWQPEGEVGEQ
eukprot:2778014-Alexandrium_andersonii.AAC.1